MGISVFPSGSSGYTLKRVITTSQSVDLGRPVNAYVILAGGGGSGGHGGGTGGAGGGAGGVVAGPLVMRKANVQIGAGGAAKVNSVGPGNSGSNSYLGLPTSPAAVSTTTNTRTSILCIGAGGGSGGFGNSSPTYPSTSLFASFSSPSFSGINSITLMLADAGGIGGANDGASNLTATGIVKNINEGASINYLYGWTTNNMSAKAGSTGSQNGFPNAGPIGFGAMGSEQPVFASVTTSSTTTYSSPVTWWSVETASGARSGGRGGRAGGTNPPDQGTAGYWAGGGGGGSENNQAYSHGSSGGGGRFHFGGLGGVATSTTGGGGGGGGGGVFGDGADGTASSNGGNGGDGGLGGGGGGGTGGSSSNTKSSGKGGDGICLIFY